MSILLRDVAQGQELLDAHRSSGLDPELAESRMFADGTAAKVGKSSASSETKDPSEREISKLRGLDDSLSRGRYKGSASSLSDLRQAGALPEEQPAASSTTATDAALDALMGGSSDEDDDSNQITTALAQPVRAAASLRPVDEGPGLQLTSRSRTDESSRGRAAKLQYDRSEAWLQARVHLQPGLRAANRLPRVAGLGVTKEACEEAATGTSTDRQARALRALPDQQLRARNEVALALLGLLEASRASLVGSGTGAGEVVPQAKLHSSLPMVGEQLAEIDDECDGRDDDSDSDDSSESEGESEGEGEEGSEEGGPRASAGGSAASAAPGRSLLPGGRPWALQTASAEGEDEQSLAEHLLPTSEQFEEALDAWWEGVLPSAEAAVDAAFMRTSKRHRRGGAAGAAADGSALLKPPSKQAAEVADTPSARERKAHARAGTFVPLCAELCDPSEMPVVGGSAGGAAQGLDPGTYEDGDFLQYAMRELSAMGKAADLRAATVRTGSASEEAQAYLQRIRPFPPKRREGVDTRASKGRRMRYTVMPKLVGFVAAKPGIAGPPPVDVDTLLRSVFKSNA